MSCEFSFSRFCSVTAASPAVAEALGDGDSDAAAAAMGLLVDLARGRAERALVERGDRAPSVPERAADLQAKAGCTALFTLMASQQIAPPVHGTPKDGMAFALPKNLAAQYGYAALTTTLDAINQGRPIPELAREIIESRRAMQDAAATAGSPPASDPLASLSASQQQALAKARSEQHPLRRLHQLARLANTMPFGAARAIVMREAGLALLAYRENTGGGIARLAVAFDDWSQRNPGQALVRDLLLEALKIRSSRWRHRFLGKLAGALDAGGLAWLEQQAAGQEPETAESIADAVHAQRDPGLWTRQTHACCGYTGTLPQHDCPAQSAAQNRRNRRY